MRERNHGAGDHPIPFRTRQLSPASPMVLRRQAAGEQDVPLTQGARAPREQKTRSKDRLRGGLLAYGGIFLADAREQRPREFVQVGEFVSASLALCDIIII